MPPFAGVHQDRALMRSGTVWLNPVILLRERAQCFFHEPGIAWQGSQQPDMALVDPSRDEMPAGPVAYWRLRALGGTRAYSAAALAKVAAAAGGRYISHVRSEDFAFWKAIDEIITIGREARLPVRQCPATERRQIERSRPKVPACSTCCTCRYQPRQRQFSLMLNSTPACWQAASMACASAKLGAKGFWQNTFTPWAAAASVWAR